MSPASARPAIVPQPLSVTSTGGEGAELSSPLLVTHTADDAFAATAAHFRRVVAEATGWDVRTAVAGAESRDATSVLELSRGEVEGLGDAPGERAAEGYRLRIGDGGVAITAPSAAGAFYGLQTLRQLLPPETLRRAPIGRDRTLTLSPLEITDCPRFGWRGVHLDVCRHYMPKSFILKLIELISFHKCNSLHLHLTDDQGWRVPIAAHPRLVEVGAWRRESAAGHAREGRFDGLPHGGFYSRADLEEIVAFAAERHVTALPEVEMPGHVVAALAAYPRLGNGDGPYEVLTEWGISDHVFNLEEETLRFCFDVLDEVTDIFPSRYVHIGGDECPTTEWKENARAAELMRENGFTDERQLQGWFTARVAAHLASLGRSAVGWDEMVESGAPPGAVVMSWRGEGGGVAATEAGHDVVMAPEPWLYFDWAQSDSPLEPLTIRGTTPLEKVYGYDPVQSVAPALRGHVLGAQCQLWTEYVTTPERAEYQYFPRLCALAEVLWSAPEREFSEFEGRLVSHLERLDAIGVNYRPLAGPTPGQAQVWLPPG